MRYKVRGEKRHLLLLGFGVLLYCTLPHQMDWLLRCYLGHDQAHLGLATYVCLYLSYPLVEALQFFGWVRVGGRSESDFDRCCVLVKTNYCTVQDVLNCFCLVSFLQDHIEEVLGKWESIDDEIWAKVRLYIIGYLIILVIMYILKL